MSNFGEFLWCHDVGGTHFEDTGMKTREMHRNAACFETRWKLTFSVVHVRGSKSNHGPCTQAWSGATCFALNHVQWTSPMTSRSVFQTASMWLWSALVLCTQSSWELPRTVLSKTDLWTPVWLDHACIVDLRIRCVQYLKQAGSASVDLPASTAVSGNRKMVLLQTQSNHSLKKKGVKTPSGTKYCDTARAAVAEAAADCPPVGSSRPPLRIREVPPDVIFRLYELTLRLWKNGANSAVKCIRRLRLWACSDVE